MIGPFSTQETEGREGGGQKGKSVPGLVTEMNNTAGDSRVRKNRLLYGDNRVRKKGPALYSIDFCHADSVNML